MTTIQVAETLRAMVDRLHAQMTPEEYRVLNDITKSQIALIPSGLRKGGVIYDLLEENGEWEIADDSEFGELGVLRINSRIGNIEELIPLSEIGKTVFLTREDAEAALAQIVEENGGEME